MCVYGWQTPFSPPSTLPSHDQAVPPCCTLTSASLAAARRRAHNPPRQLSFSPYTSPSLRRLHEHSDSLRSPLRQPNPLREYSDEPSTSSAASAFRRSQYPSFAQALAVSRSPLVIYWCVTYLCVSMHELLSVWLINEYIYYVPHVFVSHCCVHGCVVWTCVLWFYMQV